MADVTALRRPPVRQSVLVRSTRAHTFGTFVGEMGTWWPELTFAELGPALTKVSVVHSGWEKLSDEQLAKDCALPGGYLGGAFDKGWALILGKLAQAAEEAA